MNQATITGRLAQEPEMSEIPETGTAVAKFTLAVTGSRKDKATGDQKTEWIDCATFGKTAEIAGQYLHKGSRVLVQGDINTDKYDDRNGNHRSKTYISVYKIEFMDQRQQQNSRPDAQPDDPGIPTPGSYKSHEQAQEFDEKDDDLPF